MSVPWPIDISVSHFIQSAQPAWLTAAMKFFGIISAPELYLVLAVPVIAYLIFQGKKNTAVCIIIFFSGNAIIPLAKFLIGRPRPTAYVVNVLERITSPSFPSGHALGAVLLVFTLLYCILPHVHKGRHWLLYLAGTIYILLVGYDRVYLGVHWMSDVLAGYICGGLWIATVLYVLKVRFTQTGKANDTSEPPK